VGVFSVGVLSEGGFAKALFSGVSFCEAVFSENVFSLGALSQKVSSGVVFAGAVSFGYIFTVVGAQSNKITMQKDKIACLMLINSIPFPPYSSPDLQPPTLSKNSCLENTPFSTSNRVRAC